MHNSTLFPITDMKVQFPPIYLIEEQINGNSIQQVFSASYSSEVMIENYVKDGVKGFLITSKANNGEKVLAIVNGAKPPKDFDRIIRTKSTTFKTKDIVHLGSNSKWIKHPKLFINHSDSFDFNNYQNDVIGSWCDAFQYLEEDPKKDKKGLRSPQIGAIHSVHAHWTVTNKTATIVMPTGTGKTETMLSLLISEQCQKLMVIVPTDALRTQIAGKFKTLGILRDIGVVSADVNNPIVGILKHKPQSIADVDNFFEKCNVIITTMSIAGQCSDEIQNRMADYCPYLFIDEAHHTAARTWNKLKHNFKKKKIIQFTATPYRNDNKSVDGKIIFNYPLKKAQEEEYFKPINFKPVKEFDPKKSDQAIALKAIEQLRKDKKKYNHILMARVDSIDRAKQVFSIYKKYHEFNPVQIHTGIKSKKEVERIRQNIISGDSSIVVCVDMLGEGFDLPELKIAAFHDIRKSFAVTIQLAGRFTRVKPNLGEATVITNIADINVRDELSKLYSQDADWNVLLPQSSDEVIQEQVDLWEFIEGFNKFPKDIPLQNLRPAMSTVVYKTKCKDWSPDNFEKGIMGRSSFERIHHDINNKTNTLVFITAKKVAIDWAQIKEIYNWDWELYVLFWDKAQNLLFIHSSNNSGYFKDLAVAVAGNVELVKGANVFRCFAGVNRLKFQNIGLIEQLGRLIRFTMRAGSDIEPALSDAQKRNTKKSNFFGIGYEGGNKTSIGCSYKGRIWSRRITNVEALTKWCSHVGKKVLDENIDPEIILEGTLIPIPMSRRPNMIPICIDWPEIIYKESETAFSFITDNEPVPLYFADIVLINPTKKGKLKFAIVSETINVEYELALFDNKGASDCRFSVVRGKGIFIKYGSNIMALENFFYEKPPTIWFVDGSSLEGNTFTELKKQPDPYAKEKIQEWDWPGINIRKEAQGIKKEHDSIQYHVIKELKKSDYNIIFDDDGPGEAADIVGIRADDKSIKVDFYHCKFSKEDKPGARIDDLYAVCGQAQKSIHWMGQSTQIDLFSHLMRREPKRKGMQESSRFEKGDHDELFKIREMSRTLPVKLKVFIVQPGLSKKEVSTQQLELLSVTENYLMETFKLPFVVISSH